MSSSLENCQEKNLDSTKFLNREQFLQSCMPQEFPFPMTMMKYIWMNPSSSISYQKLIQCCKLFFIKNPILIFEELRYECGWEYKNAKTNKWHGIGDTIQSNIWVTKMLRIDSSYDLETVAADVIPKIFRYDVEFLELFLSKADL